MATGNRLLVCVIAIVVLCALGAAYSLALHGRDASAFLTVAVGALGVLSPSALKSAKEETDLVAASAMARAAGNGGSEDVR